MTESRHLDLMRTLYARGHKGIDLGLDRVQAAARTLGDPQHGLPVLHVAGTNGKGSTCAMLEAIALEAGLTPGLYTSPHLSQLVERIRIGGTPIDTEAFDQALDRVLTDAPEHLTFFETLTLAAFLTFQNAKPDVVILEVGLGGRLDATNIVEAPIACAITNIAEGEAGRYLEHENLLGRDIPTIATEKAGIAKPGVPLVIGPTSEQAQTTIRRIAETAGATPIWTLTSPGHLPEGSPLRLAPTLQGPHQLANATVAAAIARLAAPRLSIRDEAIERGIVKAKWPGRMERLDLHDRHILLDCAHNIDGARALAAALQAQALDPGRTHLVFGALADKAYEPMLRALAPLAHHRVYTTPGGRAPASLEALSAIAEGTHHEDPRRAMDLAFARSGRGDTIVVTGSIYLVGTLRAHLLDLPTDPVIAL